MSSKKTRRDFIKTSLYGAGAAVIGTSILTNSCSNDRPSSSKYMGGFVAPKLNKIRCGFIGVGARGSGHMMWTANHKNAEIIAFADPHMPTVLERIEDLKVNGVTNVKTYTKGDEDYLQMLKKENLDVVFIATPWEWHAKQAVAAMEAGVHAFVEVPLGIITPP